MTTERDLHGQGIETHTPPAVTAAPSLSGHDTGDGQEQAVTGRSLIAAERRRQIQVEGYSIDHDVEHGPDVLMAAAFAYTTDSDYWPWEPSLFKPRDWLSNNVRAGALYQAAHEVIAAGTPMATIRTGPSELRDKIAEGIDGVLAAIAATGLLATEQVKADVWDAAAKAWAEAMETYYETYYEPSSTERMYWPDVVNPHRPLVSRGVTAWREQA